MFQAKAHEGLTHAMPEWGSYNGGNIVDDDGKITVNNPTRLAGDNRCLWIGTIAPTRRAELRREDARGVFQNRTRVVMRTGFHAGRWATARTVHCRVQIGVAALPKGGKDGGRTQPHFAYWQLANGHPASEGWLPSW